MAISGVRWGDSVADHGVEADGGQREPTKRGQAEGGELLGGGISARWPSMLFVSKPTGRDPARQAVREPEQPSAAGRWTSPLQQSAMA